MHLLVTGATGFIGHALACRLVTTGHRVRAVVRDPSRAAGLTALGVECHPGDITDKTSLLRPMAGVDGVFHLAGWYKVGVRDEATATRTNVHGTRNVLEAMRECEVPRGVYTSTLAVNSDTRGRIVDETYVFRGRHISLYDRTKAEAHAIARSMTDRGLPLVILQPGLVYGPGDTSSIRTMFRQFLRRTLLPIPTGTAFCWSHVDDIVTGHIMAMVHGTPGRSYFLAGPIHTVVEALDIASDLTDTPAPRHLDWRLLRAGSQVARVVERFVALQPQFTAEGLRVLGGTTYIGSSARAARELGWTARPLKEGLRETLDHERLELGMATLA